MYSNPNKAHTHTNTHTHTHTHGFHSFLFYHIFSSFIVFRNSKRLHFHFTPSFVIVKSTSSISSNPSSPSFSFSLLCFYIRCSVLDVSLSLFCFRLSCWSTVHLRTRRAPRVRLTSIQYSFLHRRTVNGLLPAGGLTAKHPRCLAVGQFPGRDSRAFTALDLPAPRHCHFFRNTAASRVVTAGGVGLSTGVTRSFLRSVR